MLLLGIVVRIEFQQFFHDLTTTPISLNSPPKRVSNVREDLIFSNAHKNKQASIENVK